MIDKDVFEDLFVLEMANNHLGSVERGLKIIQEFAQIVRFNNVRASIKLQFRDVENFIHKDFQGRTDLRYVKKTLDTRLTDDQYAALVKAIRQAGCIAKEDLPEGHSLTDEDVYLAIPLQKGQLSCRELMSGEMLLKPVEKDQAIHIDDIDSPYAQIPSLKKTIYNRGLDVSS